MPPKTTSVAARGKKPASATRSVRTSGKARKDRTSASSLDHWNLRLYVAGQTPKSVAAIANLRRFCEEHLANRYSIEVIDLLENPGQARTDQILAIPTLVRKLPSPMRKIIGDLSDREKVLVGFDLRLTP